MTSKISCFDRAVFRRSVRRTLPLWVLLACYCLLLPLRLLSYCRGVSVCTEDFFARVERTMLDYARLNASVLPFLFGGLLAWVQFSWLFRTNTAYFYAALPVRRETLFLTNYLTGLLFYAGLTLLSSLLLWAVGAGFGAAAFWPAMQAFFAAMLGFLLFYSFALLVCMIVGQMAAMPIVYLILNFAVYVLESIVQKLLYTFVYGMPYTQATRMHELALRASPLLGLLQGGLRIESDWRDVSGLGYEINPQLVGWGYLGLLAALGVIFAVCAFFLLRRREMERSGSVIAVGWLRPVALYAFTIGCALVIGAVLMELLASNTAGNFWYVLLFLVIGAFLGYFSGKMLLQKTVHVFRRGWIGFGVCCLALVLAFSAAEFDLFGYSRYLPQREEIQAAGLTQEQYFGSYTSADGAYIDDVLALHTTLVENRAAQEHRRSAYQTGTDQTQSFYITYRMADGQLVERYYSVVYDEADAAQSGSLISQFSALYNSTTCVRIRTGFDTPRTEKNVLSCYVYSNAGDETGELTGLDAWAVYDACRQDIDAGQLGAGDISGIGTDSGSGNYTPLNLIFTVTSDVPGETDSLYVESIPLDASATITALESFGFDPYWPVTKS